MEEDLEDIRIIIKEILKEKINYRRSYKNFNEFEYNKFIEEDKIKKREEKKDLKNKKTNKKEKLER